MAQQSNTPNQPDTYGGISNDEYLYPTDALGVADSDHFVHVPDGAPIHHDQVPAYAPDNFLDFIKAGTPDDLIHEFPAQFFDRFKVKPELAVVPRMVNILPGTSGLIIQGVSNLFGYAIIGTAGAGFVGFRDGIDLSGQPVLPATVGAPTMFGRPGIRFWHGIYADFTGLSAVTTAVVYTLQEFPSK